jgi:FMN phosphatase YigB (HAD superfamily)
MIAIGDGWWLPNVCARHFGAKDTQTAYDLTKEYMASADFELRAVQGLKDALHHLCDQKTSVLLTNSKADDVKRLLRILELTDCFTEIVTEARKPQYANRHFSDLIRRYDVRAAQSISIGDNYLNDIVPALEEGMQTVLINYSDQPVTGYDGPVVRSISKLLDDLKRV